MAMETLCGVCVIVCVCAWCVWSVCVWWVVCVCGVGRVCVCVCACVRYPRDGKGR